MTGWGIPHTSGIKEIDYYITSTELEPPEAKANYTETLVRLPGGLPCCFQKPGQDYKNLPREYFILPPGDTLIGCLQGLHKLHPDYDLILEEIAVRNPEVGFVFVEDELASRSQIFLDRLAKSAPSVRERCVFLAIMQRHEYQALCNCVDLLLDPIYYGSGITFFEASFVGTPIVTMEGSNLRTRVVASGYREMGIEDPPITKTKEEYVELVTMLVNEPERRESMRASILANNHRVFNRMDHIRSFEQFCLQAVKSERHRDDDHPIVS
jgi:predicted O-linked N-acetylglucosamine transferase (SPINDLY family)